MKLEPERPLQGLRGKARAIKIREKLNLLKDVPCKDCGGRFPPACMDFDHVRGEKSFNLATALSRGWSKVLLEVEKCDVVCANCHRLRTYKGHKLYRARE